MRRPKTGSTDLITISVIVRVLRKQRLTKQNRSVRGQEFYNPEKFKIFGLQIILELNGSRIPDQD